MNLEGGHDLMFRFLNGHQVPELVRFRDLAFADRRRVRFEEAQDFVGDVRVSAEDPRARLLDTRWTNGRIAAARPGRAAGSVGASRAGGADALPQSADHRRRIPLDRARRGHQLFDNS